MIEWSRERGEILSRPATAAVSMRVPCLALLAECPSGGENSHQCLLPMGHSEAHWDHGKNCIPFGVDW